MRALVHAVSCSTRPLTVKILFITADDPFGGEAGHLRAARDYLEILLSIAGCQVRLFILEGSDCCAFQSTPSGLEIGRCGCRRTWPKRALQALSLLSARSAVLWQFRCGQARRAVVKEIERYQPTVVVLDHIRSAWLLPELGEVAPARVYISHNAEADALSSVASMQKGAVRRLAISREARKVADLEGKIVRSATAMLVQTVEDAARLKENVGTLPPYIVQPPRLASDEPEKTCPSYRQNRLLLVGSFMWYPKRRAARWLMHEVLPAVRSVVPDAELHIVGAGASELGKGLVDGVVVHSDVPEVAPYFLEDAIFVVPDRQVGGIKNKVVEAASYGLSVVLTPEAVEGTGLIDKESCLVASDTEEFSSAVLRLMGSYELRSRLGNAARAIVCRSFNRSLGRERLVKFVAALHEKTPNSDQQHESER